MKHPVRVLLMSSIWPIFIGVCPCRLCLVQRVSNSLHFVDPVTCQTAELSSDKYYRAGCEFKALLSASRLTEFMVLGWEAALAPHKTSAPTRRSGKHR